MADGDSAPPYRIRIAIVDNHQVVADSLRLLIDAEPDMEVVGIATSVEGASCLAPELDTDVVLIDLHLSDGRGTEAATAVRALYPATRLIMLSREENEESMAAAVSAGANAFIAKTHPAGVFMDAIRGAAKGVSMITPAMVAEVLSSSRERDARRESITGRQLQVLELMNAGLRSREIAACLGISYSTVRSHIRAIEGKLGSHSKVGAVVAARDLELVS